MLPESVELMYTYDPSRWIKNRLNVMTTNGLIGLGLVLFFLFIFLNLRTAFWVAMSIPITLMGVFFLIPFFDVYLDIIALSAMIMVIGLIVDEAIV